ncbi:MAG: hypothetical protein HYT15_04970 [Candidatus Magasanikbacteria bacterium]|nr:hypothetical protein [Candidatus Magasanikbacteria bacterium]
MKWKKVDRVDKGITITGNHGVPPTRWWNHWWLALFGWKTIVTFSLPDEVATSGYRVGFTTKDGKSWCKRTIAHDKFFSMKIGYEDCKFWVKAARNPEQPDTDGAVILPELISRGPLH